MARRQGTLTGLHCHHAGDPQLRPDCQGFATVAYGPVALCDTCDQMRSTVGREHPPRKIPAAALDRLALVFESLKQAEQALAEAVGSARDGGASWDQIGEIVGTTRQAAHQRWASQHKTNR